MWKNPHFQTSPYLSWHKPLILQLLLCRNNSPIQCKAAQIEKNQHRLTWLKLFNPIILVKSVNEIKQLNNVLESSEQRWKRQVTQYKENRKSCFHSSWWRNKHDSKQANLKSRILQIAVCKWQPEIAKTARCIV